MPYKTKAQAKLTLLVKFFQSVICKTRVVQSFLNDSRFYIYNRFGTFFSSSLEYRNYHHSNLTSLITQSTNILSFLPFKDVLALLICRSFNAAFESKYFYIFPKKKNIMKSEGKSACLMSWHTKVNIKTNFKLTTNTQNEHAKNRRRIIWIRYF